MREMGLAKIYPPYAKFDISIFIRSKDTVHLPYVMARSMREGVSELARWLP